MVTLPLILTARLDREAQAHFDDLRERYFPPERNFLRAHVTLFHALPQEKEGTIRQQLRDVVQGGSACEGYASGVVSLGSGVAFTVESPKLVSLRGVLASIWRDDLTAQDRHRRRLHITVQNKVTPEAANSLRRTLSSDFQARRLVFEGLDLWQYEGGPWSLVEGLTFPIEERSVCR